MPLFRVTTADGSKKDIKAKTGTVLMETLRDAGLVDGTCGGAASCGTCHVYFTNTTLAGEHTEDEGFMLDSLEDFVEIKDGSRLSCQIVVSDDHDGAAIEIAPEA